MEIHISSNSEVITRKLDCNLKYRFVLYWIEVEINKENVRKQSE